MELLYPALIGLGGLIVGLLASRLVLKRSIDKQKSEAEDEKKRILKEAELSADTIKKNKILEAKEKYLKLKSEFEEEANRKKNQIISNENKLRQRESSLSKLIEQNKRAEAEYESMKDNLAAQLEIVKKRQEDYEKLKGQQVAILEKVSNLTADEAKDQLLSLIHI